jgi:hypothetical protein
MLGFFFHEISKGLPWKKGDPASLRLRRGKSGVAVPAVARRDKEDAGAKI